MSPSPFFPLDVILGHAPRPFIPANDVLGIHVRRRHHICRRNSLSSPRPNLVHELHRVVAGVCRPKSPHLNSPLPLPLLALMPGSHKEALRSQPPPHRRRNLGFKSAPAQAAAGRVLREQRVRERVRRSGDGGNAF